MGKLHEVIAVENKLKASLGYSKNDTIGKFTKAELFNETATQTVMFDEDSPRPSELMAMTTTVVEVLDGHRENIEKFIDHQYSKEEGNTVARADIVLQDGTIIEKSLPVGNLISLKKLFESELEVIKSIPVLQQGIVWDLDESHRYYPNVFKNTNFIRADITKKVKTFKVIGQNDKFPGEVKEIDGTETIGFKNKTSFSSALPANKKTQLISRCDELIMAITTAIRRANETECKSNKISNKFTEYLFGN